MKNMKCSECKHHFSEYKTIGVEEKGVICSECGTEISLTKINALGNYYMCYECQNIIAISYENEIYQPLELLKSNWNFKNVENKIEFKGFNFSFK